MDVLTWTRRTSLYRGYSSPTGTCTGPQTGSRVWSERIEPKLKLGPVRRKKSEKNVTHHSMDMNDHDQFHEGVMIELRVIMRYSSPDSIGAKVPSRTSSTLNGCRHSTSRP